MKKKVQKNFKSLNERFRATALKSVFYSVLPGPTTRFVNGLVYGAVGLFGCLLALRGEIAIGIITTFLSYANSFGEPFSNISEQVSDIQQAFAAANRVFNVLEENNEISDARLPDLLDCTGEVENKKCKLLICPKNIFNSKFKICQ